MKNALNTRDIKFRCWHTGLKKMFYRCQGEFYDDGSSAFYIENGRGRGEDTIPMQYIEIKDVNGKEIYESDIVKIPESWSTVDRLYKESIGVVKYEGSQFYVQEIIGKSAPEICFEQVEILGNIYEDSDLIEQFKNKEKKIIETKKLEDLIDQLKDLEKNKREIECLISTQQSKINDL